MSLNSFQKCDPSHEQQFQYCCLRSKKIFCQTCWFKDNHPYKCFSSKCGHYEKIIYATIQKNLQIKTMHFNSQMCSSYNKFDEFYKNFFRFKELITQKIKTDIESKLPLFIWAAFLEMMSFKNPALSNLVYEESMCSDLLRLLKKKEQNKIKLLEQVVRSYDKMLHQYHGFENKLKNKQFSGTFDKDVEQIVKFCINQGGYFILDLNTGIKGHLQEEVSKLLKKFNPEIKFQSIKFNRKSTFESTELYNSSSLYSSVVNGTDIEALFHGVQLKINKLQKSPEILLQVTKSILKQKIYDLHNSVTAVKSSYPYKYGYVIATCLEPDPQFELSILNLQKSYIKSFEKRSENSFLSSINLIIMGPELITIEHRNYPKKLTEINIFGYRSSREKFCSNLIETVLGSGKSKKDSNESRKVNQITFQTELSSLQLVYLQFQLAYEHLFTYRENISQFQGEKYVVGRGIKLFENICSSWNQKAILDLPIQKNEKDYMPYIY